MITTPSLDQLRQISHVNFTINGKPGTVTGLYDAATNRVRIYSGGRLHDWYPLGEVTDVVNAGYPFHPSRGNL